MLRVLAAAAIVIATMGLNSRQRSVSHVEIFASRDSAMVEFQAGRFWHAARILRKQDAASRGPRSALLLARAEAGWGNWPAVAGLLAGVELLSTESNAIGLYLLCLLYTSPSPRDQ